LKYFINEASFELDGAWQDETVQLLTSTDGRGDRTALVMSRAPLAEGDTVAAYADRMVKGQSQELRGYELVKRREAELDGRPSLELKFKWDAAAQPVFQQQTFVERDGTLITFSLTSALKSAERAEAWFDEILSTVRFRSR
jgi:hypothetical protein